MTATILIGIASMLVMTVFVIVATLEIRRVHRRIDRARQWLIDLEQTLNLEKRNKCLS